MSEAVRVFDGRTINAMDDETKRVHVRLESWARWAKDTTLRPWPTETLLARIIEEGAHGAQSSSRVPTSMPDGVANVDLAVARAPLPDQRVIRKYYLEWAPPEVMARSLHLSPNQFRNRLTFARRRLAAFLDGLESKV